MIMYLSLQIVILKTSFILLIVNFTKQSFLKVNYVTISEQLKNPTQKTSPIVYPLKYFLIKLFF
jgi:hypothetical protein